MAEYKSLAPGVLEKTIDALLDTGEYPKLKEMAPHLRKAARLFIDLFNIIDSEPDSRTVLASSPSTDDAKKAVLYAREKGLDFNAKDTMSANGKGKEGTRFNDPGYTDVLTQEKLDLISARLADRPEYTDLLLTLYINRFCCEEKHGSFTWKEVSSDGTLMYSKKTQEEVKDILSLYTVNGKDAYSFYMSSPYRLARLT